MISIDFDPSVITYNDLLELFWNNHEYGLTTRVKRQYSSVIFYHNQEQKRLAVESIANQRLKRIPEEIITEILKHEIVYPAEE